MWSSRNLCVEDSWPLMSGYIQAVDLEETWARYCLFAFFFFNRPCFCISWFHYPAPVLLWFLFFWIPKRPPPPPPFLIYSFLAAWIFVVRGLLSGSGLGLDAVRHAGSEFSGQELNPHPMRWRRILNHWTTRDIPQNVLFNSGIDLLPSLQGSPASLDDHSYGYTELLLRVGRMRRKPDLACLGQMCGQCTGALPDWGFYSPCCPRPGWWETRTSEEL